MSRPAETPDPGRDHPGLVGEIISERWARSFRNDGPDHLGMAGGFRNPQSSNPQLSGAAKMSTYNVKMEGSEQERQLLEVLRDHGVDAASDFRLLVICWSKSRTALGM
jgi:hypothetical protein